MSYKYVYKYYKDKKEKTDLDKKLYSHALKEYNKGKKIKDTNNKYLYIFGKTILGLSDKDMLDFLNFIKRYNEHRVLYRIKISEFIENLNDDLITNLTINYFTLSKKNISNKIHNIFSILLTNNECRSENMILNTSITNVSYNVLYYDISNKSSSDKHILKYIQNI
jgi:hypothetical protein